MSRNISISEYRRMVSGNNKDVNRLLDIQEESIKKKYASNSNTNNINYGNRGMSFEKMIESSNLYYKNILNVAYIRKIPTPIKVLELDKKGKIVNGFYEKKSSLDFNGIYKRMHIDFDTKETKSKTSFAFFSNVSEHQIEYMKDIHKLGGITFLLVNFKMYEEVYLLSYEEIEKYFNENKDKKSIPYLYFKEILKDYLCEKSYKNRYYVCDYLQKLDKLIESSL